MGTLSKVTRSVILFHRLATYILNYLISLQEKIRSLFLNRRGIDVHVSKLAKHK